MGEAPPPLDTAWLGRAWRQLPRCGSTNDEAAAWGRAGAPHGAVVVADAQEGGRGRLGRSWYSPPGESLYLSVLLRPSLAPQHLPPLTLAAGVAVADALGELGLSPRLKWPNDVLLDGRKVAGVLTELSCQGMRVEQVVVGIGVNLNASAFPVELRSIATSARLARGGAPVDRARFAASLCGQLERRYQQFLGDLPQVIAAWRERAWGLGRPVRVLGGQGEIEGIAEDLEDDGALRLRDRDGKVVRVLAGELV